MQQHPNSPYDEPVIPSAVEGPCVPGPEMTPQRYRKPSRENGSRRCQPLRDVQPGHNEGSNRTQCPYSNPVIPSEVEGPCVSGPETTPSHIATRAQERLQPLPTTPRCSTGHHEGSSRTQFPYSNPVIPSEVVGPCVFSPEMTPQRYRKPKIGFSRCQPLRGVQPATTKDPAEPQSPYSNPVIPSEVEGPCVPHHEQKRPLTDHLPPSGTAFIAVDLS
jgi:hypothetical protein